MIAAIAATLAGLCRRHAVVVLLGFAVLVTTCGIYTARNLSVDTDTNHLISPELPWRKAEAAFDKQFPHKTDLIAIVIDGATGDAADDAAGRMTTALAERKDRFRSVVRPDGGDFFRRQGMLLLPIDEVQAIADQLISAQALLGALAQDPGLRGLFDALALAAEGVTLKEIGVDKLEQPFTAVAAAVEGVLAEKPAKLDWQSLLTGRQATSQELRRFVLVQPILDYADLQPGAKASEAIRDTARQLGLTPENGVRVRLTGSVPLSDDEFATVAEGAGTATIGSLVLVGLILFAAVRSIRLIVAILVTLIAGLVLTAAFACVAVGALNIISVAFAVLFIGIAVDFSIQVSTRYRDERFRVDDLGAAIDGAARSIATPLLLAAVTTSIGFYAFVPTDYSGVSELGIIAGTSMMIAVALNLTLLPALFAVLKPPAEAEPVGYPWAARIDSVLIERRTLVLTVAGLVALAALFVAPRLTFDFNPLNLKDPKKESMATLLDLMADPATTPNTIDTLVADEAAARALADRLEKLPEVEQVLSLATFIPTDQAAKLAILEDLGLLIGPTLSPPATLPPASEAEKLAAIAKCADWLVEIVKADPSAATARRLEIALRRVVAAGTPIVKRLDAALTDRLAHRLDDLRLALEAKPVTLETLPADLKRDWIGLDGRWRLTISPKGDSQDNDVLRRFVAAVVAVEPNAIGTPISIQESGRTVVGAFTKAGILAISAICLLLLLVLRRIWDVLLVLLPLALAALLTISTSVLIDLPLNFANIITLPLLLGIGVAFDIYFVMNWRGGQAHPLSSSTARAIVFSSLTTVTAFGSLAFSAHPGTSEMGKLLTLALFYTLFCTLVVLPALLGKPVRR